MASLVNSKDIMEELLKIKFEKPLLVRMPTEASSQLHPSTQLHEKRRELDAIEQTLQSRKQDYSTKIETMEQRAVELAKKEQALKEWLFRYDKFLKENSDKRDRALRKVGAEINMQVQKDREIKRLRKEIESLMLLKAKTKQKVERYSIYHQYLDGVQNSSEEFSELREILDRHETLVMTYQELRERDQRNEELIDQYQSLSVKYMEDTHTEILACNNRLSELQSAYDKAHVRAGQWESSWTHIKNTAAKKTILLGQVKMACHNLYQIILKVTKKGMFGEADPSTDDATKQLLKINEVIEDLQFVINEVKKTQEKISVASDAVIVY